MLARTAPPQPSDLGHGLLSYEPPFPPLQPGAGSACPTGDERTISVKRLATRERAVQRLDEARVNVHCSEKKKQKTLLFIVKPQLIGVTREIAH